MEKEIILKIRNLSKKYDNTYALDNVSLDIHRGDFTVILGSSGSGKSTLLNLIGGMDKADSGSIYYQDKDIIQYNYNELSDFRRYEVGFIFQSFNLISDVTVRENIILQASLLKDHEDIDKVLEDVGLTDKKNAYPSNLSGGQQQRVSIARCLVKKSELILCDEPTGALDYETGRKIIALLYDLAKKKNKTVLFVTHTKEIAKLADHVIKLRSAKVIEDYENEEKLALSDIEW